MNENLETWDQLDDTLDLKEERENDFWDLELSFQDGSKEKLYFTMYSIIHLSHTSSFRERPSLYFP